MLRYLNQQGADMRNIYIVLSLIVIGFWSTSVSAAPKVMATVGTTHAVALAGGSGLPLSISYGVGLFQPLENGWGAYGELAVGTGFSGFSPAPKVLAGGSYKLNDKLTIGCLGLYSYTPADSKHLVGIGAGPVILTKSGVGISLPVGPVYSVKSDAWALAFTAKLSFAL